MSAYDAVCSAADRARGLEELILALMESPTSFEKALCVLHEAADATAKELEGAKDALKPIPFKKAS